MYSVYNMVMGDTLESVASLFNTTEEELIRLNGDVLNNQIVVPNGSNIYNYYKVKKGDTISNISSKYGVSIDVLLLLNGLNASDYLYPDDVIMIPRSDVLFYLTKENDTLNSVIKDLGISIDKLIKDNKDIYLRRNQFIVVINDGDK